MKKSIRFILKCLIIGCVVVATCEKNYLHLEPGAITAGNVTFWSRDGYHKSTFFTVSVPKEYSLEKDYPMIIALHNNGNNAKSFHEFLVPIAGSLGYVILAPQGEHLAEDGSGWDWGPNAQKSILACFNVLRNAMRIDPDRIYLIGFCEGGKIANELYLDHPQLFQGMALLNAPLDQFLPSWKNDKNFKHLRFYIGYEPSEWHSWEEPKLIENILHESGLIVKFVPFEKIGCDFTKLETDKLVEVLKFLDYP